MSKLYSEIGGASLRADGPHSSAVFSGTPKDSSASTVNPCTQPVLLYTIRKGTIGGYGASLQANRLRQDDQKYRGGELVPARASD